MVNRHLLFIFMATLAGCASNPYSHYEKGQQMIVDGEVDNIVRTDVARQKKIYSLTAVGFTNGQGVTLVGIHPGLSRGKRVKVIAEFTENLNGTDVFRVVQIAPATVATAELPAPTVPGRPIQAAPGNNAAVTLHPAASAPAALAPEPPPASPAAQPATLPAQAEATPV
jgi:hypothetical protein